LVTIDGRLTDNFAVNADTDTLSLSDQLTVTSQSFGSASSSRGFSSGIDGILGLGPSALTRGTVQGQQSTVPTVLDNLAESGKIPKRLFGVSFSPVTKDDGSQGSISFGDVDNEKVTGDVTYTSIPSSGPTSKFWGLQSDIKYNSSSIFSRSTAATGFLDTGTTLILLSSSGFKAYQNATGAQLDTKTGLLKVDQSQYESMGNMTVSVEGRDFEVTRDAQRWPKALNGSIGGDDDSVYLAIGDVSLFSGFPPIIMRR
jgi:hypothetical protein